MTLKKIHLAMWLAIVGASVQAATPQGHIGILEEWSPDYADEISTTSYVVRLGFTFDGEKWSLLAHENEYPSSLQWIVTYDGKKRGEISSQRISPWKYNSEVGLYQPAPFPALKLVTEYAKDFRSWTSNGIFRPLVAVSGLPFADPDGWKPWNPARADIASFFPLFRVEAGTVSFKAGEPGTLQYPDERIIAAKCYRAKNGDTLVSLQIDPKSIVWEDGPPDDNWAPYWFHVQSGKSKFIGDSLALIDAGDYDGDGTAEVVFHQSGYNRDGYLLFYDHLGKQLKFEWSYH